MPTYYTPTIEDLVWGLEYESLGVDLENGGTKWGKAYCDAYKGSVEFLDFIFRFPTKLRIKYLDEDDIIELGWNLTYKQQPPFGIIEFTLGEDYKLFITDWEDVTICSIEHKGMEDEYLDTMFSGICKNKAELKRLMNKLSITK